MIGTPVASANKLFAASLAPHWTTRQHLERDHGPELNARDRAIPRRRQAGRKTLAMPARGAVLPDGGLFLQEPLEDFHLFLQRRVILQQGLDLTDSMKHRGMVATAEAAADLWQ
jgi:hypothetical protein